MGGEPGREPPIQNRVPIVLSLLALVAALLALAQRGTASSLLPPRSVGTAQLKNGAVTAAKVRAHSLLARDFRRGQLPKGPAGPAGPPGPSEAYWTALSGPLAVHVGDTPATLAELEIPVGGSYVVTATAYFDASAGGIATLTCRLDTLEGDADEMNLLAGNPTPASFAVVHTFAGPGAVDLSCAGRAKADAHSVRITALRVGALSETGIGKARTP